MLNIGLGAMRCGIIMIALLAIACSVKAQQDPQFSQNRLNHMTVNPAFAGEEGRWMVSGIYRNQWQKMDGAPETYAFNVDTPLKIRSVNGGIGLNMMSDKLGMQTNLFLMLNYSYKHRLNFGVLSVGIKAGLVNAKIEGEYYIPGGDRYTRPEDDPALGGSSAHVSKMMFDAGVGMFLSGRRYYAGVSLSHVTKPKMTIGQIGEFFFAPHMYFSGGYTFELSPVFDLQPSAFIQTDFVSSQYTMNASAIYKKRYWGGLSYRYEESVIFMGGLELKDGFMIGYSYDWNVSGVGKYTGGSHEVTLSYSFGLNVGKQEKLYKSVRFL